MHGEKTPVACLGPAEITLDLGRDVNSQATKSAFECSCRTTCAGNDRQGSPERMFLHGAKGFASLLDKSVSEGVPLL